ncbi:MAG: hypothetical protein MI864_00210 [Pseudomonadales bacterium]|nr:hypothetical protein [Pseudomonadales bacterium]
MNPTKADLTKAVALAAASDRSELHACQTVQELFFSIAKIGEEGQPAKFALSLYEKDTTSKR